MNSENMKFINDIGFVPLVVANNTEDAVALGKALVAGGIPIAEVTFRTDEALACMKAMSVEVPELLLGAGTVHTVAQAEAAVAAGATFIVTPAFNPAVIEWCLDKQIDIIPGTVSPAEIEQASAYGLKVCKFFPAGVYGGPKALKAFAGPFSDMKFLPTGGVDEKNMEDYLALPNVFALGGSFLTPSAMLKAKDWTGITRTCQSIMQSLFGFSLGHIGLQPQTEKEAEEITDTLCRIFLQEKINTPGAFFAGSIAEICKKETAGEKGHICIDTYDLERAMAYYHRKGIAFNKDRCFYDDQGRIKVIFFAETTGGFSMHLRRKSR